MNNVPSGMRACLPLFCPLSLGWMLVGNYWKNNIVPMARLENTEYDITLLMCHSSI